MPIGGQGRERRRWLTVLISSNGSNLQVLIDVAADGTLHTDIGLVISSRSAAPGLTRARRAGIPSVVLAWKAFRATGRTRADYDFRAWPRHMMASELDLVVLASGMCVLTHVFLDRSPDQDVNLYPGLPGICMQLSGHSGPGGPASYERPEAVHWVPDEGVDTDPVIEACPVPIRANDTLEALEARVHATEHRLVAAVQKALCQHAQPRIVS